MTRAGRPRTNAPSRLAAGTLLAAVALGASGAALQDAEPHRAEDVPPDTLPSDWPPATLPLGLEEYAAAAPAPPEVTALGRRLFFDPILSRDRSLACATCHHPEHGFAEPRAKSLGVRAQDVGRNASSLLNKTLSARVLWDGRAESLEAQVLMVIPAPLEMDLPLDEAVARLAGDEAYAALFAEAFGGPVTAERIAEALAAFVRRLTFGGSPVDRFRAGDVTALTVEEENGMWLYEGRGRCWQCHNGPNFSDEGFHNTGVGALDGEPEPGLMRATGAAADRGKFRTPGLRALTLTAPYMHDGSLATLEEVVAYYRRGGAPNANLSPHIAPIEMTDQEAANLVAFLRALSR